MLEINKVIIPFILISVLTTPLSSPVYASAEKSVQSTTEVRTLTSSTGAEYRIWMNTSSHILKIRGVNPTNRPAYAGVVVEVDGTRLNSTEIKLDSGGSWRGKYRLRAELNALEDNHAVIVSTFGNYTTFEFAYEIDPEHPGDVKVPRITDVSVGNALIEGRPSSVVNVTVVNPSIQRYPMKLMVHTEGTDGSLYFPTPPPGGSETITVELLDEQNTEIAGEARLYVGDFNESEGGIHQVGFVGRAGGTTRMWNESFEPVAAPWSEDPYQYYNASVGGSEGLAERVSGGVDLWGVPLIYPVGGLLLGGIALRRFLTN